MVPLKNQDEHQLLENNSRKEKIKAMFISAASSGGQQFYFNYATLIAVGIGANPIQMSFITGIQNLGSALFQGFFGRLSDRFGRKIILFLGFIIATITTIYLAFNASTIIFMVIIALYSLGISMVIPSWNALLGDISSEKTRIKIIGQISMVGTISASLILLILGFLTDYLPFPENYSIFANNLTDYKYRFMMFCGSFLFALAAILIIALKETNIFKQKNRLKSIKEITRNKSFVILSSVTLFWWFVMSFLWPLSPYVLKRLDPSSAEVAILSAVYAASTALSQISARRIVDKIGRRFTILFGIITLCVVPLILAYSVYWYIIIFANFFGGFGNGILMVAISAEVLDMADYKTKGAFSGVYNLLMGIATFCGSFLCGILFDFFAKGMEYQDINFFNVLKVFLIIITAIRVLASIPVLFYALKSLEKE